MTKYEEYEKVIVPTYDEIERRLGSVNFEKVKPLINTLCQLSLELGKEIEISRRDTFLEEMVNKKRGKFNGTNN